MQKLTLSHRATVPQKTSFYYTMTVPASYTGVVFPELPDVLVAFRPGAYSNLSLETMMFDRPTSYNDYLEAIANYNGLFYDAEGLRSYSYARISRLP